MTPAKVMQTGSMHHQAGKDACVTTRLIVAKYFFQPAFELAEE
jgi:hypothetical protein